MLPNKYVVRARLRFASAWMLSSLVLACRGPGSAPAPIPRPQVLQLTVLLDRHDTTTSPRESWSLKTEMHAVYHLSWRQVDTVLFGEVRLDSVQYLSTTSMGTRADPVTGTPRGPILGFTFTRRGAGAFEVDSVPTSARPRGLNQGQVLEIPNLVLVPPSSACRIGGTWIDSTGLPSVPVAGATPSTIWWRASFRVDSINRAGAWIGGRVELRGEGEGPLPTRLRDDRTVVWLFDRQCAAPIRLFERRQRTLVTLDPETLQPHDSASASGTATATFARAAPSNRPPPHRR